MEIIDRIRRRREFRARLTGSRARLYRTAYAWCHDTHLADDLVQQTVCNALQNQGQLRNLEALDGWLFRILARCLADHRRLARHVSLEAGPEEWGVEDCSAERAARDLEIVARVRRAVDEARIAEEVGEIGHSG